MPYRTHNGRRNAALTFSVDNARRGELRSPAGDHRSPLPAELTHVGMIVEKEIEKQVIVKDPGSSEETSKQTGVLLNAIVSELNPIVWWLIGSAAMLTVICFALAFLYFKSKSKREVREVWEN